MPKRKGTDEKKIKPGRENYDHNARVAMWGPFADARYDTSRQLAEGWSNAKQYETALDVTCSATTPRARQRYIAKENHLQGKLRTLTDRTISFVRAAVENGDGEAMRKLGDVIDHMKNASQVGSPDLLFLTLHVKTRPAHHIFTFIEIRDVLAEVEGLKPPFDEAFEQRVRRMIKKLEIPLKSPGE